VVEAALPKRPRPAEGAEASAAHADSEDELADWLGNVIDEEFVEEGEAAAAEEVLLSQARWGIYHASVPIVGGRGYARFAGLLCEHRPSDLMGCSNLTPRMIWKALDCSAWRIIDWQGR